MRQKQNLSRIPASIPRSQEEFISACQDLPWTHDTNTPYRPETNVSQEELSDEYKTEQKQGRFKVAFPLAR